MFDSLLVYRHDLQSSKTRKIYPNYKNKEGSNKQNLVLPHPMFL